jgi:hypothetical protein
MPMRSLAQADATWLQFGPEDGIDRFDGERTKIKS